MHGYQGHILHINLTTGQSHIDTFEERFAQTYLRSARVLKGMSLGYATSTRGGNHHDTRPTLQYATDHENTTSAGKPEFAVKNQHFTAVGDSLTQCRGGRRSQDVLPYRVMYEPVPEGMHKGMHCPPDELSARLDASYALRGWSADGVPTPDTLRALGLAEVVGQLG